MEASSRGDGGPRGRICRDAPSRLNDGTPPGTEVSSGPSNTRRSWGRGVEEANGITHVRTPGNSGVHSHSYATDFPSRVTRSEPPARGPRARSERQFGKACSDSRSRPGDRVAVMISTSRGCCCTRNRREGLHAAKRVRSHRGNGAEAHRHQPLVAEEVCSRPDGGGIHSDGRLCAARFKYARWPKGHTAAGSHSFLSCGSRPVRQ